MKPLLFTLVTLVGVSCTTLREAHEDREISRVWGTTWQSFRALADHTIKRESLGYSPGAGERTWGEYYTSWFKVMREVPGTEAERRISYIKNRRAERGLPPIE